MTKPKISIVVPIYGCSDSLKELYLRVKSTINKINCKYELILVNDNSPDNSWNTILELSQSDKSVKGIKLSRNFGQHIAITTGLTAATGDWIVVMDCDLQDQPEEIIPLYEKAIKDNVDIVLGRRYTRKDKFLKRFFSDMFYRALSYLTETRQDSTIGNFGIYHKKVIQAVLEMKDSFRYFPTQVRWVGFKSTNINIEHAERKYGKTTYNFKKMLLLALDVILAFSDKPLRLTIKLGSGISILSIGMALFTLIQHFRGEITQPGYASLIISIWFLVGILIMILGFIGLYIGKIFEKVKQRPLFIVDEKTF